ncbi:MAG: DUF4340 domain-containing protein [Deltaproteobacteria bacterium]|nr:DUF4340 domain-containing protein [Deltaproteobacteria bacterium]MBW1927692.1 DUF4340 domain-containing protein [Deltaproteobacteria bacterium]MBW2026341.1 DUF4340 domain-containing protein [Deltaproteobacteria bacterium]
MRTKTLVFLLGVLAALAAIVGISLHKKGGTKQQEALGTPLFHDLAVNKIAWVTIQGPEKKVSLRRGKGHWEVVERYGYPADFSRIVDLLRKMAQLKIGRRFQGSQDVLARLSLHSPLDKTAKKEEKGTLISLRDEKGSTVAEVILGKTRRSQKAGFPRAGQYVRIAGKTDIFLVDRTFPLTETDPVNWLDKKLLKVPPEQIRRISATGKADKLIYAFERTEKGKGLEPIGPLKGSKINQSKLKRLERAVSSLWLQDVLDPATDPQTLGLDQETTITYELFDGVRYHIRTAAPKGTNKKEYYLQIKKEAAQKAKQINDRFSRWVFIIPKWAAEAFLKKPEDLVEKPHGKKTKPSRQKRNKGKG